MDSADSSEPSRPERIWLGLLDGAVLLGLIWVSFLVWSACAPRSMVGGDASLPLSCGWAWFLGDWAAVPEQPIYGYGLCATAAPLFLGVDSLSELALRRSLLGATVVPLVWLLVRFGASLLLPLSPAGVRVAAAFGAVFVLRHDGIGWLSMTGVNGYFAGPFVCLILFCWVLALRGRSWASGLALALTPFSMMNHPFTVWLLPASIPLAVLVGRRGAWSWVVGGALAALSFSWPRIARLRESLEPPDARTTVIAVDAEVPELLRELSVSLLDYSNLPILAGVVLLLWGRRSFEDSAFGQAWARACGLGFIAVLALGAGLKYLRYYHLIWLFPFVLLPLAAGVGRAYERLAGSEALRRLPGAVRVTLCSVVVLSVALVVLAGSRHPLEPWCPPGELDTQSAGGASIAAATIIEDLQRNPSTRPVVVGNLNSGASVMDSAFPVVQGLGLQGVPLSRLSCCAEGQEEPTWYWLISPMDGGVGNSIFAGIPGAEVLLHRETGEWIVALRTPSARALLQARFCESFGGEVGLSLVSHDAAMSRLPVQLPEELEVPEISWDCQHEGGEAIPEVRPETPTPEQD